MTVNDDTNNKQKVISIYDYKKTKRGRILHDNMVNLIASRCKEKGADVSYDPRTVDLYVNYKSNIFLVEVKSVTPTNFVSRLRTAIGQVCQYDFLMHHNKSFKGRLGLAFTAKIPRTDWSIPFVTEYLNMDLLCMDSNCLSIKSSSDLSLELYG